MTDRTLRRWRERLEAEGYSGLVDRRKGKPSDRRVPLAKVEEVLRRTKMKGVADAIKYSSPGFKDVWIMVAEATPSAAKAAPSTTSVGAPPAFSLKPSIV
jgi:hypothetical protein